MGYHIDQMDQLENGLVELLRGGYMVNHIGIMVHIPVGVMIGLFMGNGLDVKAY